MTTIRQPLRRIAIACGGTGGHLFPGLAVAAELQQRGSAVTLFISEKEVDHAAAESVRGMEVVALPAVGLSRGTVFSFVRGFARSYRQACGHFQREAYQAVLAMGGFTSAAPVLAGKRAGAVTFLHESNTVPGRANRWLARLVDGAFVGFPDTARRLKNKNVAVTGTPVRAQFVAADPRPARGALGLNPERPTLLVMGGSQGATGINQLAAKSIGILKQGCPALQVIHLTGKHDYGAMKETYARASVSAVVREFSSAMETLLAAASVAVSRAGASSLAELAAMRIPAVLVPYPAAVDNHQWHNARAFELSGAALLLEQKTATPESFAEAVRQLLQDEKKQAGIRASIAQWHAVDAPRRIADAILEFMLAGSKTESLADPAVPGCSHNSRSAGGASGPARCALTA